jgi:hypothetical protein
MSAAQPKAAFEVTPAGAEALDEYESYLAKLYCDGAFLSRVDRDVAERVIQAGRAS